jgi:hypothetical protein
MRDFVVRLAGPDDVGPLGAVFSMPWPIIDGDTSASAHAVDARRLVERATEIRAQRRGVFRCWNGQASLRMRFGSAGVTDHLRRRPLAAALLGHQIVVIKTRS